MAYELTKESIVQDALDMGFTNAGLVDVSTLQAREEVRDMCAVDKCHGYNKNWSCPPGCGTVPECDARMKEYDWGVITQITLDMEDAMDMEAWTDAGKKLHDGQVKLNEELHKKYSDILALGGAGCNLCAECTYPDAPCRFPEKRMSGMEAYGLVVRDVCMKNGLKYYYGPDTVTFSGMFLIKENQAEG